MYQSVLRDSCIAGDGLPVTVSEASLQAFGVRAAGLPDEPEYLHYVPRDADQGLREAMQTAREDSRLLLVIGASASGKSRSAAEAVRNLFGRYRLLCPQHAALSRLPELPLGEVSPALVWLDDLERYDERALKDTVVTLRRSGVAVVATMRRGELRARTPDGGRRSPLAEALADAELVAQFPWPANWSAGERDVLAGLVQNPSLRAAARDTVSPSAWVVAGPALQRRLDDARADDERPARYALIRTVLDWYRTGTAQTIARDTAIMLLRKYLPDGAAPVTSDDIDDAFTWAFGSVLDTARTTRQSLLTSTPDGGGLLVHDYIQDRDAESRREAIPDSVLAAALGQEGTDEARLAIGDTARAQGSDSVAFASFFPLRPLEPSGAGSGAFAAPRTGTPRAGSSGAQRNHPYRGLMPFSEADADVFYGRDHVTAELAKRLERDGPVDRHRPLRSREVLAAEGRPPAGAGARRADRRLGRLAPDCH